ncbi:sorbosone dehydrogenase family protein [Demequina sp. NBRC 110053]|uniref:PQQ-dependent sugar dehydrogenase n=1 Tax=Demequina sp. NBRC 110053 TaxID=1570342 RepID=UPI000A020D1E|nr:PQQ-dependent sugar dehydrogenase [Demequina sp. NBRC 110053]
MTPGLTTQRRLAAAAVGIALNVAGCGADAPAGPSSLSPTTTLGADAEPQVSAGSGAPADTAAPPDVTGNVTGVAVSETTDVATGLAAPWDAVFAADGSILVTERDAGRIVRVVDGEATPLGGPGARALASAVDATGEAGLLGIALHPDDPSLLYVYLTRGDGNAVVSMGLDGDSLTEPVDVIAGIPKARNHDGGRIAFGPDGFLYVATGDAAQPQLAQDRDSLAGKILRVVADGGSADGDAAPDNPFGTRVWSWGHRNVQGLAWLPDGTMVASEFGQSDADELNVIVPGANYGWPTVEGLIGAPDGTALGETVDGLTYPVAEWRPTSAASPSGIAATEAGVFVAALRGEALFWVPMDAGEAGEPVVILDDIGRVRAAVTDSEGTLYALTNNTDGRGSPDAGDDRLVRIDLDVQR